MVVFFNKNDKNVREIVMVEHDVMSPSLPANKELDEKIVYYEDNDISFVSFPYELGGEIYNYNLCFNENGEFIGITPKKLA